MFYTLPSAEPESSDPFRLRPLLIGASHRVCQPAGRPKVSQFPINEALGLMPGQSQALEEATYDQKCDV